MPDAHDLDTDTNDYYERLGRLVVELCEDKECSILYNRVIGEWEITQDDWLVESGFGRLIEVLNKARENLVKAENYDKQYYGGHTHAHD